VTLATKGPQTITVKDTATASTTVSVTVQATTITATGQVLTPTAGQAFTGTVATFRDSAAGAASDYTAQITWGDGQTSAGQVTMNSDGSFTVMGTNTYAQSGFFKVTVQISSTGGSAVGVTSLAFVTPAQLGDVADKLTHSFEFFSNFIIRTYQRFLARTPNFLEIRSWAGAMGGGMSDETVEAGFIGSGEYIARHGGPGLGWVRGLYQDLLGRTGNLVELMGWVRALLGGMSPTAVAFGFAASAERESQRVQADYQNFLGRAASAAEVAGWTQFFVNGGSNEDVVAGFVGSREFFTRHGGTATQWLGAAYGSVFGRAADSGAFGSWMPLLR
jgi:hypothetical protein